MHEAGIWMRAASVAARLHRHDVRKDGKTPYVAHVFRVAMIVRHLFGCEDEACLAAALLHDTIEDTGADYDEIADGFGREVADLVAALTKNMILPEREREAEYDRRLARADWRARLIKLADAYDNITDMLGPAGPLDGEAQGRALERARRAIALAEADAAAHEPISRGIEAVRSLLGPGN